ncbi:PTS system, cellobiose-specific IIB component [Ligilactobacillus sp. WC1T17]|uniref:PTS system, cellobiose-specific IIB component n=1 Tax=Ligilactobacillus ruminis TaxID=1623 RepID=A0ABY1A960_9LACO|nr:PTS system, cellobiose-specific IIB component [Ligilactobacillus ruminis]
MAEKTIMLCCAAGMSTSLLVSKMQEAAKKQGLDYEIFATSASDADNQLAQKDINVVLLGPQVRYMEAQFKQKLAGTNIPMAIIDMTAYGMMNGEKVLAQAIDLMKQNA